MGIVPAGTFGTTDWTATPALVCTVASPTLAEEIPPGTETTAVVLPARILRLVRRPCVSRDSVRSRTGRPCPWRTPPRHCHQPGHHRPRPDHLARGPRLPEPADQKIRPRLLKQALAPMPSPVPCAR